MEDGTKDNSPKYDFGMIGLGVMGSNLLLNIADHGFKVIGYNRTYDKAQALEASATKGTTVKGVKTIEEFVAGLSLPRKMVLLVPAGKPVDDVIESLLPLLDKGDVVIDGGNSHYTDTLRRVKYLEPKGFHFMGMGVSGGEEGARLGPSIMPGGDKDAYNHVRPMLEACSAKVNGEPCTAYMGKDAAGHYVKMVHNGIEYAIMQLISEVYDLLHRGLGLNNDELHQVFAKWNEGELKSYLIDITKDIFLQNDPDTGKRLVDMILDKAGSKGTGKWTSQDAMELPVPIPTIDMAVSLRTVSAFKDERVKAAKLYPRNEQKIGGDRQQTIDLAGEALYAATILCYAQGLAMINQASNDLKMEVPMDDVVKIWRGGCIIRSELLNNFYEAFRAGKDAHTNILLDGLISKIVASKIESLRKMVVLMAGQRIACGGLMSALGYFDAYTSAEMPTNLIQAQRDYFGAHTYQRIDKEGIFHTKWEGESNPK